MESELFKRCNQCGRIFEDIAGNFYKRISCKDGYSKSCKKCFNRRQYELRKCAQSKNPELGVDRSLFDSNLERLKRYFSVARQTEETPVLIPARRVAAPSVDPKGFRISKFDGKHHLCTNWHTGRSSFDLSIASLEEVSIWLSGNSIELM